MLPVPALGMQRGTPAGLTLHGQVWDHLQEGVSNQVALGLGELLQQRLLTAMSWTP